MNGWLEQARQRVMEWGGTDWAHGLVTAAGTVGTDGLVAAGLLLCLVVALLVRRRGRTSASPAPPVAATVPALEVVRDDRAARTAAMVAALLARPAPSARLVRMEEQGGHLTRMVSTLIGLGSSAEPVLAALGQGDTGPALAALAGKARAGARNAAAATAFRDLAALALVDDPGAAVAAARRASELAPERPEVWSLLAVAAAEAGDLAEARVACDKVLTLGGGVADKGLLAGALGILGEIHLAEDALDRAEDYFRIALTYQAGLARPGSMTRHYRNLCRLHQRRGDLAGAADILSRALALETQLGRRDSIAALEQEAGALAHRRGKLPDACRHWARARELFQDLGQADKAAEIDGLIAAALRTSSSS